MVTSGLASATLAAIKLSCSLSIVDLNPRNPNPHAYFKPGIPTSIIHQTLPVPLTFNMFPPKKGDHRSPIRAESPAMQESVPGFGISDV